MSKFYYSLFFALWIGKLCACQCPITKLDKEELDKYSIIFNGVIKSVKLNGENSEAVFELKELYKGISKQEFKILFNNDDNCKIDLRVGDEWLIYSTYYQIDNAKLDFCSRSRKFIKDTKNDFFIELTGITFDDERLYLKQNLGIHHFLKEDDTQNVKGRNIIPNTTQFFVILICSVLGMFALYYCFNKFFK